MVEEKSSYLEDIAIKIIENETQKENRLKKWAEHEWAMGQFQRPNICMYWDSANELKRTENTFG